MEIHQIRYFLSVCETLNFTRAAERCNVTQPALSRAIQKLEEELGGQLFRRERSLTHLTDLGHLMRPQLEKVVMGEKAAKAAAREFLKLDDAPLKLGIMCTIGPLRGIGFLADFRARHPGIAVTLKEGVPTELSEMLMSGDLDVAIMAQEKPFDERFDRRPLYRERFSVALPPGHRLTPKNAICVTDLANENYLQRLNCEYYDTLRALTDDWDKLNVKTVYKSEREDWIQTMVIAGMGICFIPEFSPTVPGLVTRPLVDPEVSREVLLVSIAGRRFSPAVATFVKAIKSYKWPTA
ncbi:transcriptional regulator [Hypericibacter terrae]|jgi:DNA-binding transcriptional LysR family regulator|uniref:Transcriptional regulator n=1 Tax=Hypericibacter terrae TaxID=2602015 RepID=A0A5J6MJC7_9PROT|nr:LysR family transcriptional regulator [Hypericibacter terrae]QEX17469.1 transcriptional regulator [Hypericibacter terrae]